MAYSSENISFWVNQCEKQRTRAENAESMLTASKQLISSIESEKDALKVLVTQMAEDIKLLKEELRAKSLGEKIALNEALEESHYSKNRILKII